MSHTHNMSLENCLQIADSVDNYSKDQIYAAISVLNMALKSSNQKIIVNEVALEISSFPANYSDEKVKQALKTLASSVRNFHASQKMEKS